MKQLRLTARFLALGFAVGILLIFSIYRNTVQAVQGTATFTGTDQTLTGDITAGRLVDQANTAYYIDPAASGNSLVTAGTASVSGNLVLNAGATIGTTNMQPLTIGSSTTGLTKVTSGGMLQLQAGGTGTGSTGTGSIYFLDSSGNTRGRFDTNTIVSATGGTIATASGYTIHTFTNNGTFTPSNVGNVGVLVVGGGGGGGGAYYAGGGGGGGVVYSSNHPVTVQGYSITVGGGGAGGSDTSVGGTVGGDSIFSTLTAGGGGGGGSYSGVAATAGRAANGNGGGSSGYFDKPENGNGAGYSGGGKGQYSGGGGGGAGAVGGQGDNANGGEGGTGASYSISGSSVTYGGGGGGGPYTGIGGTGGSGGGGAGGDAPVNGTANTGGGGGGKQNPGAAGGNGGSGIVIIRYPTTNYGSLYLNSTNTSSADLAEYYVTGDKSMEPGDVVTINANPNDQIPNSKGVLLKSNKGYDSKLVGIISTNPGVIMGSIDGENKEDKRMLALSGRVPVKIDPDSAAFDAGDFLTSSTKPGFAMKATRPGYVVGRALESWAPGGPDRIEAFIQLTYYMGDIDPWGNFRTLEVDTLKVNKTLEVGGVNVLDRLNKQQSEIDELKAAVRRLDER